MNILFPSIAASAESQEQQIGDQVYQQLKQKGEILTTSPYYAILDPIAAKIKSVADSQYDYPFHFLLVHEKNPNAFAVPGGRVYVTDSLMKFVENREELAGVLCHETSHDIHHDVVNVDAKNQRLGIAATLLGAVFGRFGGGIAQTAVSYAADFQSLNYSRKIETAADLKGSDTCAAAGYNPWGMVWLFTHFEKADSHGSMEMLSDHPTDSHRIDDLHSHFLAEPQVFSRYSSDIRNAHALGKTSPTPLPARTAIPLEQDPIDRPISSPESMKPPHQSPESMETPQKNPQSKEAPRTGRHTHTYGPVGNDVPAFP